MQFITNGPDIPDALLQAHEDGRVVFFCGAGISYPAGLPGFDGLVAKLCEYFGERRDPIEEEWLKSNQFDRTLGHFEGRVQGGRRGVRRNLSAILSPDLGRPRALTTHLALLTLARRADNLMRVVTTNFDTLFEIAREKYRIPQFPVHPDPPSRNGWEGLVYLHGRMPAQPSQDDLDRLILSDVDFGKAYLTEAWAARFVANLFREYMVCFVGYSIDDPVLRYMTAAHAANDRASEMYAFASFNSETDREEQGKAWWAKNVTPILYDDAKGHRNLHRSLWMWASVHRDGVSGLERLVTRLASRDPRDSKPQDDFVGRMLWALSDKSGLPAKRFADFNPVPSLEWLLEAFSEDRYQHGNLARFDVPPRPEADDKLRFSLIRRPAPYTLASPMMLVSGGATDSQWDAVMFQLARWLVRHLNDPALIIWLAQRGGQLHDRWPWLIEDRLNEFARLEHEGKTAELEELRANAPNAIPGPLMQTLWRLLLTGRVKSPWHEPDLYRWKDRLKRDGLTTTLRLEMRELLSPKVTLKKPFRGGAEEESTDEPTRIKQLVDWELVLAADHVNSSLRDLADERWRAALPALLDDFQQLLRDALDLLRELGEADDRSDRSYWDLPSISPHWQNQGFHDWVTLIELLRDAWLVTREIDRIRANHIAQGWFSLPYSTFKRLALFAASHDDCIPSDQWVDWLVADDSWWLWSVDTQRETMRLMVLQGTRLAPDASAKLETAILAGPPRAMYRDGIEPDWWVAHVADSVWLHLAKLMSDTSILSPEARSKLAEIPPGRLDWKIEHANERNEFSHWMSGTGDPDYEENREIDLAPRKRQDLVNWLKRPPPAQQRAFFHEDTWSETCRTRFFHCAYALCDLAHEGLWPVDRWREALQAWGEEGRVLRSWRFAAPLVRTAPDEVLQEIAPSITWWLEAVSKSIDRHEALFLDLCRRVLLLSHQDGVDTDQPVMRAINHPVGHVTQALLNLWFKREPNDNDTLPDHIEPFFTQLCDTSQAQFRHGRVVLASHLIALFRVDRPWTEKHLLPLFDWTANPVEAKAVWEGFLRTPRLYRPLLIAFKSQFLATARHNAQLGEHSRQFAAFLTYAALDPVEGYVSQDFQTALGALPQEGLQESAQAMVQALEGAGEQCEENWRNRIRPFWQDIWPKSQQLASNGIANSLARLSIAARGEFPSALASVLDWLRPIEHPDYVIHRLHESGLAGRFPEDALRFLSAVLDDQPWVPRELGQCLDAISLASPALLQDHRYRRLTEYARRRGV